MAPSPAHLRTAADELRVAARRLDLDLGPLAEKGDDQTWQGPAATAYRRSALDAEGRGGSVTSGLRRIARRLDAAAVEIEAAVARARAEEARLAEEAERVERERAQDAADPPGWLDPDDGMAGPPPTVGSGGRSAAGGWSDLVRAGADDHG